MPTTVTVPEDYTVHGIFPNYYDGSRVSYSFKSILEGMAGSGVAVRAYVLGNAAAHAQLEVNALLPMPFFKFTSRLIKRPLESLIRRFQHRFLPGDVAYLWLTNPPGLTRALQRRGVFVVREMINCTVERSRRELSRAHEALGTPCPNTYTDEAIGGEREELMAADAVFCPNDFVLESVKDYGVPDDRCLRTSYGWSPERMRGTDRLVERSRGTTFLFVGTGNVRKGLPWLLKAWARADVNGKLLIAGTIDPDLSREYAPILARNDVIQLGHVADIGAVYRSAEVFCFPSWEEGGPMVTIEAMGMGLACVVTPMGGAGILSSTSGGALIVPEGDVERIAGAIKRLAGDRRTRERLGQESMAIARDYVWAEVGKKRARAIDGLRARA